MATGVGVTTVLLTYKKPKAKIPIAGFVLPCFELFLTLIGRGCHNWFHFHEATAEARKAVLSPHRFRIQFQQRAMGMAYIPLQWWILRRLETPAGVSWPRRRVRSWSKPGKSFGWPSWWHCGANAGSEWMSCQPRTDRCTSATPVESSQRLRSEQLKKRCDYVHQNLVELCTKESFPMTSTKLYLHLVSSK